MECLNITTNPAIEISNKIYDKSAVIDGKNQFSQFAKISITPLGRTTARITFQVKPKYIQQQKEIINEFLNYILDLTVKNKEEN